MTQQWQGLIAINYAARRYGLTRHITITEAKKLCPNLIMQHVATWKEGDDKWAYHDNAFENIHTHKVSLDPYRCESRKILATIRDVLPPLPVQRVEKASIDEVFLDLSAQVHSTLLERYPELGGPAPYDDASENLPKPPTTALGWDADALVDLDTNESEEDDPDWDDVAMLIGSEIVRRVRAAIRERLRYTCSAGIARNKFLAKLGSGHKKPNQQTIIRNRAVEQFLSGFKFTKIRNLGGKLGDEVTTTFGTDTVKELLQVPLEMFRSKFGDDTGNWMYQTVRGIDHSEVNSRTQIKSMLSAKSFRPSINTFEQGIRWLRIFVADIYSRLVEEGVLTNKRRPRTLNLHHRQGAQMRSHQAPIPSGKAIDETMLFDLAKNLLGQVVLDGRAWPCATLQLSVGGFEDGITGNRGIGAFLVKSEEAKALKSADPDAEDGSTAVDDDRDKKRRKLEDKGIQRFFTAGSSKDEGEEDARADFETIRSHENATKGPTWTPSAKDREDQAELPRETGRGLDHEANKRGNGIQGGSGSSKHDRGSQKADCGLMKESVVLPGNCIRNTMEETAVEHRGISRMEYICTQCSTSVPLSQRGEHEDWHVAKTFQEREESNASKLASAGSLVHRSDAPCIRSDRPSAMKKAGAPNLSGSKMLERGQRRLTFGR